MRNNLTGIELVTFSGESVLGEFKFGKFHHDHHLQQQGTDRQHHRRTSAGKGGTTEGDGEDGENAILEFDMKEKHLKDCDRKFQK